MMPRLAIPLLFFVTVCLPALTDETHWIREREKMVEDQIEARGIVDQRVIAAMRNVPRHLFVPKSFRTYSYGDFPLPIGQDQTISQPYIVALMTEALALHEDDRTLEIGTGSGYQAAILAEIASEVYTVEIIPSLALRADSILKKLGYTNIEIRTGDGYQGWEEFSPFDAIIITCAPPTIPQPLIDQLADGGRIVAPLGDEGETQILTLIEKTDNQILYTSLIPCIFVPMRSNRIPRNK